MAEPVKAQNVTIKVTRDKALKIYNALVGLTNQSTEAGAPVVSVGWVSFSRTMANLEPVKKHYDDFLKPLREKVASWEKEETSVEEGVEIDLKSKKQKASKTLSPEEIEQKKKDLDKEIEEYLAEELEISVRTISISRLEGEKHNAMLMSPLWDTVLTEE
jgi:hypothetical protein